MDQLIERCCGLDVHRDTVAACVRVPGPNGKRQQHVRTFGTTTADLLALRDWLEAHGVTHVAMECTGVYWKPVFYVLEEAFTCLLVNAAHVKQVPGRKTDVQGLHVDRPTAGVRAAAGQLRPAGADPRAAGPDAASQGADPGADRAANRLHKLLQDAGIKLASVATDILGVSGRAMLEALVARARRTPRCWPTWPGAGCARSCRPCARRWPGGSGRTTRSWSAAAWPTWTIWTRRSRR